MINFLVIADPHIPIPPEKYGGTERIVHLLCDGLKKRGYNVNLLAAEGSKDYGGNLFTYPPPNRGYWNKFFRKLCFQSLSLRAIQDIDVIINHGRVDNLEMIARTSVPLLCQFHNAIRQSEIDFVLKRRKDSQNVHFAGVSESHIKQVQP